MLLSFSLPSCSSPNVTTRILLIDPRHPYRQHWTVAIPFIILIVIGESKNYDGPRYLCIECEKSRPTTGLRCGTEIGSILCWVMFRRWTWIQFVGRKRWCHQTYEDDQRRTFGAMVSYSSWSCFFVCDLWFSPSYLVINCFPTNTVVNEIVSMHVTPVKERSLWWTHCNQGYNNWSMRYDEGVLMTCLTWLFSCCLGWLNFCLSFSFLLIIIAFSHGCSTRTVPNPSARGFTIYYSFDHLSGRKNVCILRNRSQISQVSSWRWLA